MVLVPEFPSFLPVTYISFFLVIYSHVGGSEFVSAKHRGTTVLLSLPLALIALCSGTGLVNHTSDLSRCRAPATCVRVSLLYFDILGNLIAFDGVLNLIRPER